MRIHLLTTGAICAAYTYLAAQPAASLKTADKLFKEQHWSEARAAYDRMRGGEKDWHAATVRQAVEGAVSCSIKLQQWDDATTRMEEFIAQTKGSFEEALGQRFLAGLYLTMPH